MGTGSGNEVRSLGPHVDVLMGVEAGKYPDGNSVLVRGRDGSLLIDPSLSARGAGLEVDRVVLTHTHEDHAAGVSGVRFGELSVHEADLAALRSVEGLMALYGIPPDARPSMTALVTERFHFEGWPDATGLRSGQVIDLGDVTVTTVHAPGHTGGHSVFLIEPDGVLVTGDIDLTGFGPYYGDAASDLADFERTLATVREIAVAHYVTFHHKGVITGHDAFAAAIDDYGQAIVRRERDLLALLAEPADLESLVATGIVYRPGTRPPVFGESVERRSIGLHLDRLVADGAVATDGRQYWRA